MAPPPIVSNGILMRHGSNSKNIPMKLLNVKKLDTRKPYLITQIEKINKNCTRISCLNPLIKKHQDELYTRVVLHEKKKKKKKVITKISNGLNRQNKNIQFPKSHI